MTRPLLKYATVVALAGCSSGGVTLSDQDWQERMYQDARKPGVMAQICVLETRTAGHLHAVNVRRERNEPGSIGSTLSRYLGTSSSGQYIFQTYLAKLEEFRAAVIFPVSPEQQVFLPKPSLYSATTWSEWVTPDLISSDRDIQFKLLSGRNVPKESPGPVKAMARFKIGSYVQWRQETDGIRPTNVKSDLEPCPLTPNSALQPTQKGGAAERGR